MYLDVQRLAVCLISMCSIDGDSYMSFAGRFVACK